MLAYASNTFGSISEKPVTVVVSWGCMLNTRVEQRGFLFTACLPVLLNKYHRYVWDISNGRKDISKTSPHQHIINKSPLSYPTLPLWCMTLWWREKQRNVDKIKFPDNCSPLINTWDTQSVTFFKEFTAALQLMLC